MSKHANAYRALAAAALGTFLFVAPAWAGVDVQKCRDEWDLMVSGKSRVENTFHRLNPEEQEFFRQVFLPVVGLRGILKNPTEARHCTPGKDCVILGNFGPGKDLRIQFIPNKSGDEQPRVQVDSEGRRVLLVPKGFDFAKLTRKGADEVRLFLVGHPLHPFGQGKDKVMVNGREIGTASAERLALGEDEIFHREVQEQMIEAMLWGIRAGDDRFLGVSPTGTGKTEIVKALLDEMVGRSERGLANPVHMVLADENGLVTQLKGDIATGLAAKHKVRVLHWGGGGDTSENIDWLEDQVRDAQTKGEKVVLFSTIQSVLSSVNKFEKTNDPEFNRLVYNDNVNRMAKLVGTIAFDEAHHAEAPLTKPFLAAMDQAFIFGPTATARQSLAHGVFKDKVFRTYLDTPEDYIDDVPKNHQLMDLLDQLYEATGRGDLTNFKATFLNPQRFKDATGEDVYVKPFDADEAAELARTEENEGHRFILNPKLYREMARRLEPVFKKHESGFVTVNTKKEAKRISDFFNEFYRGKKGFELEEGEQLFGYMYSMPDMTKLEQDRIYADFKAGKIRFLVTIGMLDEGKNVPQMSLALNLARRQTPIQMVQRIGRVLRLHDDKDLVRPDGRPQVDVVSMQEINDIEMANLLNSIDGVARHSRRYGGGGRQTDDIPEVDDELVPGIEWSPHELRQQTRSFWSDSTRGEQAGRDDAKKLVEYMRKPEYGGSINGFERTTLAERTMHNRLYKRLNMSDAIRGKAVFREVIAAESARVAATAASFERDMYKRARQISTGRGMVGYLREFRASYARFPRLDKATDEEMAIYERAHRYVQDGDISFLRELDAKDPESIITEMRLEPEITKLLSDPEKVAVVLAKFRRANGRAPSPDAKGFEGRLAKALAPKEVAQAPAEDAAAPPAPKPGAPGSGKATVADPVPETTNLTKLGLNYLTEKRVVGLRRAIADRIEGINRVVGTSGYSAEKAALLELSNHLDEYETVGELFKEARGKGLPVDAVDERRELNEAAAKIFTRENMHLLVSPQTAAAKSQTRVVVLSGKVNAVDALRKHIELIAKTAGIPKENVKVETTVTGDFSTSTRVRITGPNLDALLYPATGVKNSVVYMENGKPQTHEVALTVEDGAGKQIARPDPNAAATPAIRKYRADRDGSFTDSRIDGQSFKPQEFNDAYHDRLLLQQLEAIVP